MRQQILCLLVSSERHSAYMASRNGLEMEEPELLTQERMSAERLEWLH
jgi:hypothetical protein